MILSKTLVVLVSGKAGVGKTTLSKLLLDKFAEKEDLSSFIIPFASSLKKVATMLGWDGKKDCKGRKLLQHLGGVLREYDTSTWVRLSYGFISSAPMDIEVVISDDWRFPDECRYLKENPAYQVFTIRVEAPDREILKGTPEYDDVSETSLPSGFTVESESVYDLEVRNDGTLEELNTTADNVVQYILDNCQRWR